MSDRLMRQPLLRREPEFESVSRRELVGIAHEVAQEAVARYERMAALTERRGQAETAAALGVLLEREQHALQALRRWADSLGEPIAPAAAFSSRLPPKLATSWDKVASSALLTPYRCYALAAKNRGRRFAFYSYLAAHARDACTAQAAEELGAEQLRQAAELRHLRRHAWRDERRPVRLPDLRVSSRRALHEVLALHEACIASHFRAIAARLRALGDEDSAQLLDELQRQPPAASQASRGSANTTTADSADDHVALGHTLLSEGGDDARALLAVWAHGNLDDPETTATPSAAPAAQSAVSLLTDAQKPLEAFSETLESLMRTTEGALFEETAATFGDVTDRLARVSAQAMRRLQEHAAPPPGSAGT